ncbi:MULTISPECIES: sensor histidine kinase [Pseudanabaena]|uniref:Oxygen sensor histidine kinase NreB n=2 Tax=Pseudanabaena TaxID=1152 RepID=L8MS07_9CYAN|nr:MULTISPECIES: sensor histidine kinase [Pseudanabaena]ELS30226.1 integral membrane sensor signal transduction histidine kinase [Pseudanabaena biceps PCC 7429]MDG3497488.1 sensor histidine kinase [Pseudanabaena catenata USMAC16]
MNSSNPSFRLLLQLEWLLLATAIIMEVIIPPHWEWTVTLQLLAIFAFGLMGLKLPKDNILKSSLYTALEFGLILLPASQIQGVLATRPFFLFCLIILMRSCLIFKKLGQMVILLLSLLSYSYLLLSKPIIIDRYRLTETGWDWRYSNIILFCLTLIFALLLINALIAERRSREKLETVYQELEMTHHQLRQYALRIEDQATLQERNRIAREIHDGLGHTLSAQTIQINNALLLWENKSEQALVALKQAKKLGAEALLEVRKSVSVLRSNPLHGKSLETAIAKLITDFKQTIGVEVGIEVLDNIHLEQALPPEMNTAVYRIVQESLTNIYKHAQAKNVRLELNQQGGFVHLEIVDNGRGFNPSQNTTGFGLQGIKERTSALCGQFLLDSQPGVGCRLSIDLPLNNLKIAYLYDSNSVS